jgi:fumarate hydratase subunit alpha/L(+)-tartrate dehydratase alpha subunit
MQLDPKEVEEIAKTLYIRAVKLLPPDIKRGFERLMAKETDATGRAVLNTMVENIMVAEKRQNLLCQDTAFDLNVVIGRNVEFDGTAMKERSAAAAPAPPPKIAAPRWCIRSPQERADLLRHRRADH